MITVRDILDIVLSEGLELDAEIRINIVDQNDNVLEENAVSDDEVNVHRGDIYIKCQPEEKETPEENKSDKNDLSIEPNPLDIDPDPRD